MHSHMLDHVSVSVLDHVCNCGSFIRSWCSWTSNNRLDHICYVVLAILTIDMTCRVLGQVREVLHHLRRLRSDLLENMCGDVVCVVVQTVLKHFG